LPFTTIDVVNRVANAKICLPI